MRGQGKLDPLELLRIHGLGLGLMLGVACEPSPDEMSDDTAGCFRIFGASQEAEALVPRDVRDAIVMLAFSAEELATTQIVGGCTGTVVSPGLLLTARHCVDVVDVRAMLLVGPSLEDDACRQVDLIGEPILHPELDAALIVFDDQGIETPSLLLADGRPPVGAPVTLAGFGLTETDPLGTRRFAQTYVTERSDLEIIVEGPGHVGACLGDSGGPLLWTSNGEWRVAGTLSKGDANCMGQDRFVAAAALRPWVVAHVESR